MRSPVCSGVNSLNSSGVSSVAGSSGRPWMVVGVAYDPVGAPWFIEEVGAEGTKVVMVNMIVGSEVWSNYWEWWIGLWNWK